jgi:phytoene dehydrogenase-like protein
VYFEVPSNVDPSAAPKGKQMLMSGYWCPSDPNMSAKEIKEWDDAAEKILFEVFPDLQESIEHKELYTTSHVSKLTRDHVLPDQGGECIGLGQIVGQCGKHKPSFKAPLQGLFYVGCDAGGRGIGIHQATDSGINVANYIRHHNLVS